MTSSTPPFLQASNLRVSYESLFRSTPVLLGATFRAEPGGVTCIIGRNGVGKTTLFRTVMGFHQPDAGILLIGEEAPDAYREAHGIGYLPETYAFPRSWTVADVLGRAVDLSLHAEYREDAFSRAVDFAGFDGPILTKKVRHLSKGNRQRLALAFALIGEPRVLLLDEPFSGLDPPARLALRQRIKDTAATGVTVLLASHDLNEVAHLATAVYRMEAGRLEFHAASHPHPQDFGRDLEASFLEPES